jgi:tRNA (guanosine-2'-O-)-methyltransferase
MSRKLGSTDLKRLHRDWRRRTSGRLGLVLDQVQSPFNVGAIVRTAAAYRVDDVWVAAGTPPLDDPKVGKTALGCDRFLTWTSVPKGADAVAAASAAGYTTVAIELTDDAVPLHALPHHGELCLVVGNEDHGIAAAALEACDAVAFLPQLGRIGSLNVATAAGIALYEVRRRSWLEDE